MSEITIHRGSGTGTDNVTTTAATTYTVLSSDKVLLISATTGNRTINLLNPTVAANRHILYVVITGTSDTNVATLTSPSGVIGVGGGSTWGLVGRGAGLIIVPDGTDYQVLAVL